ncbi:MAG: zinc ABC transporter substrate-binding protein [Planctomycetes bacterium]|nr:zinc ABC transporter substrate-binding protein [Planctomycetota bacterium]
MRRAGQGLLVWLALAAVAASAWAGEKPLQVVATLSTFADLARTIGGPHINVSAIASPKFNPHFIEPKPSDVLKVKRADLFIHAGLDLEAWRPPLLDAAGNLEVMFGGDRQLDLSQDILLLEVPTKPVSRAQGDIHLYGNPHYWVDPENARIMARHIAEKLSAVDPVHAQDYQRNLQEFLQRLEARITQWRSELAAVKGQELVGYHNEWPYLMRFAGLKMEQFLEPKPGIPPTPKQVEFIDQYVQSHGIRALVISTYFPMGTAEAVARQTGVHVVTLAQNVGETADAPDYLAMVDYNVRQLLAALQPAIGTGR